MKFKKWDPRLVFPPSLASSNIDKIRDTDIGHMDLEEYLKRVKDPPKYYKMETTINSSILLVAAFPMSTQNPEFVLALANGFDLVRRIVKDVEGKKAIIKLVEDLFYTIFKYLNIDQYANIGMQTTRTYYDNNLEKCRSNIDYNWLKSPRSTIARWIKTIHRNDFIEEVNHLITFLSRVKRLLVLDTYHE